jgi:uncharacterized protein (DUF952 family)
VIVAIYRVLDESELRKFREVGAFRGTPDDARDGFIHLSAAHQLAGTLAKHYTGRTDLMLVALDQAALEALPGAPLRWEASRGGDLFPHLYGTLPWRAVVEVFPITRDAAGQHVIPPAVVVPGSNTR